MSQILNSISSAAWFNTIALIFCVFLTNSCSLKPEDFGVTELGSAFTQYQHPEVTSWSSSDSSLDYESKREQTLKTDPSRGIGLKDAATLGGDEAFVPGNANFRVFLLMGQSNMVGYGKSSKLEAPYSQEHNRIRIWSKGTWRYLMPKRSFGPEVSFAHHLAKNYPNDTIGIIKIAVSGTGMNAWKPDWEWSAASKTGDALKGSLYRDMINALTLARAENDFQLEGFFWKQGGRDGRKSVLANSYQERFVELVDHLRSDVGSPDLPVFVLTYFDELELENHRDLLEKVRPKAMNLYLSKARVSSYLHNSYPVFHGKLPTRFDQVHFDTEGQIMLGIIAAEAFINYEQQNQYLESNNDQYIEPPIPSQ